MLKLTETNIAVIDLETARSAADISTGWNDPVALGLSIGCWFSYRERQLHWFDTHTLQETVRFFVDHHVLLVSFNGIAFDMPLMCGLLRREADVPLTAELEQMDALVAERERLISLCDAFQRLSMTSYDILAEIWKVDPARKYERGLNPLDALSQANGYGAKTMDGAQAPRLWAQGHYAEVIAYNVADVLKTKALFEQILATGELRRGDGQPIRLPQPTLPVVSDRRSEHAPHVLHHGPVPIGGQAAEGPPRGDSA